MKSKLFNQFYNNSHNFLYPLVKESLYFLHLKERLDIFTTKEKRIKLTQQKIDYIFSNFDLGNIPIIMSEKIKYPKYTKDGIAMFPAENYELNFFDSIYLITEIMLIEFLRKDKKYDDVFASLYVKNIERVFKIPKSITSIIFPNIKTDLFTEYYDGFINRDVWSKLNKDFNINLKDLEHNSFDLNELYSFKNDKIEIFINILRNKKIKVFLISNK